MLALILDDANEFRAEKAKALVDAGFEVTCTLSFQRATDCLRGQTVDLLIISERVGGQVSHSLALLAEHRNPSVATILLTERTDADVNELFLLLPALHCLIAPDAPAHLFKKIALASVVGAAPAPSPMLLLPAQRIGPAGRGSPIFASRRKREPAPRPQLSPTIFELA
ncbi:hypothetical protein [Pseudoruegeria sp. SK021]|uniref:hypothetical protein n=1 Tax=Pseudoruegeria sp. SK021 TaxID=1933035 RepID=UPI000A21F91E|nr:hypothetical protein [Pseudoruegeria sp. SK021]OSP56051.1 hypothetical protein BV911_03690 [Pseudoruegeria sp. SK021]